ncbi:unnamed protein product [Durusdinium trenchii]|uniref:Uncharacterized protein n=2 Tax=Durusdinium trenchii TaxID=1381693 RepID=A0ABP0SZP4_9DINO
MDQASVGGRKRRAELSARLAHQLHVFLESQERARFEAVRVELVQQEQQWAIEASKLERQLGSFGVSNASHVCLPQGHLEVASHEEGSLSGSFTSVVWSSTRERSVVNSRSHTTGAFDGVPGTWKGGNTAGTTDRSTTFRPCALAQRVATCPPEANCTDHPLQNRSVDAISSASDSKAAMAIKVAVNADAAHFDDFHEHLKLLLAARANVLAAEEALATLEKDVEAAWQPDHLPLCPKPETEPGDKHGTTINTWDHDTTSACEPPSPQVNKASRKDRMQDKVSQSVSQSRNQSWNARFDERFEVTERPKVTKPKGAEGLEGTMKPDSVLRGRLHEIFQKPKPKSAALAVPEVTDVPVLPEQSLSKASLKPLEIQHFARDFMEAAEARIEKTVVETLDDQERHLHLTGPGAGGQGAIADGGRVAEVGSPHGDIEVSPMKPLENETEEAPEPVELEKRMEMWTNAVDVLRAPTEPSIAFKTSTAMLDGQKTELQLEADFARRRLTAIAKHRKVLKLLQENGDKWLKQSIAKNWTERMKSAERASLASCSTRTSHLFSLMLCVEAAVAGYDAERQNLLNLDLNEDHRAQLPRAFTALDREVARALRSISETRRLFDSGGVRSTDSVEVRRRVDDRRRSEWATVYADLLQIESKGSTTITLKTAQGLAWAKM